MELVNLPTPLTENISHNIPTLSTNMCSCWQFRCWLQASQKIYGCAEANGCASWWYELQLKGVPAQEAPYACCLPPGSSIPAGHWYHHTLISRAEVWGNEFLPAHNDSQLDLLHINTSSISPVICFHENT